MSDVHESHLDFLKTLNPLPKPTYWYEGASDRRSHWRNGTPEWREEISRICRSRCARMEYLEPATVTELVKSTQPIGLNTSPTFAEPNPEVIGAPTWETWARYDHLCAATRELLGEHTARVKALLVDWEGGAQRTAAATPARIQMIRDILATYFPFAQQYWYQCGQVDWGHGWQPMTYQAEKIVPRQPNGCTLYLLDREEFMREKFTLNLAAAKAAGVPLVPIVGLGNSFRKRIGVHPNGILHYVEAPGTYWALPDWCMVQSGQWIYDKYWAPPEWPGNDIVPAVILYPGPGDRDPSLNLYAPDWERNFCQLAAGATRKLLPAELRDGVQP